MTQAPRLAHRWAGPVVALLTLAWVLAVPALVLWLFGIGMQGWAEQGTSPELKHRSSVILLLLAAVVAGGPVLVAVVAFAGRLRRAGVVYLVLAVLLGTVAVPVAAGAYRDLNPPPPPPPAQTVCQEHSGGDTRCPGG